MFVIVEGPSNLSASWVWEEKYKTCDSGHLRLRLLLGNLGCSNLQSNS